MKTASQLGQRLGVPGIIDQVAVSIRILLQIKQLRRPRGSPLYVFPPLRANTADIRVLEKDSLVPGTLALTGAAKSGAPDAGNHDVDAELNEVINAWPNLPAALKSGILAIVRAGRNG